MNWKQELSNRKQLKGKYKDKWGESTDDELDQIFGSSDINSNDAVAKSGETARSDDPRLKRSNEL